MTALSYSLKGAAEASGLSKSTLDRAIRSNALKAKRTAKSDPETGAPKGSRVILARDLQAFLDALEDE